MIGYIKYVVNDVLVNAIEEDVDICHNKKLEKAALSYYGSHSDEYRSSSKISMEEYASVQVKLLKGVMFIVIVFGDLVPEVRPENFNLNRPCGNQIIVADR